MDISKPYWEVSYTLSDVDFISKDILKRFGHINIWLLEGQLGSGKTTLVQHLAKHLDVKESVTSPTFSLVNEYKSTSIEKVYHLDLYRLKTLEDGLEIGLFELIDSGYFCIVEWASAIGFKPAGRYILIEIAHLNLENRKLRITIHEN